MKKLFTLNEVRNLSSGAYSEGYMSAFDDDEIDLNNETEVDFLISKYVYEFNGSERKNERQLHILS